MRILVGTVLAIVALGVILLWTGQRRLMYFPLADVGSPAAAGLPSAIPVTFATDDGLTLHGWWVPQAARATGHTVLIFNGNAGNRSFRAQLADRLARHGMAVLLMDYRGYGENPGAPSEDGLTRDARAAREYVAGRPDVDPARIVYFGESLGTGVAVRLASEHPPFALVLRSPFTSLADVGRRHYPWLPVRWLLRDRFDSLDRIGHLKCPVLVIAGDRDRMIPVALSDRLYDAAPSPKRMVTIEGADHNDEALADGPRVIASVVAFLAELR